MTKLLSFFYNDHYVKQLYESIDEDANTCYFVFTGAHDDRIGDIVAPDNDYNGVIIDTYTNMIFGKKVSKSDASLLVRNVPWESKVFSMYDDNDENLFTKDFYCVVDEVSLLHVYKCLSNFFDSTSTVEPQFSYVSESSNFIFQTSDNYIWKYMYSVTSTQDNIFSTQNYFPVSNNDLVTGSAVTGAIDFVNITRTNSGIYGGKKYDNYTTGIFTSNDLQISGNSTLYTIDNTTLSYDPGFYTGCILYLSSGIGSGQYSTITDYFSNANGNFIVLDSPFTVNPTNGTGYEIFPAVNISGSGTQTVNAVARALVDANFSNSIYKIEMLEKGVGYDFISANVVANSAIKSDASFVEAELIPIYSPVKGHGFDASSELGADAIEFSIKFANSESGTILASNRFQQIGVLIDPKFANVNIELLNDIGTFQLNEDIFKINPIQIVTNAFVTTTSSDISTLISTLTTAAVASPGLVNSYAPDDILTVDGGTTVLPSTVKVITTEVRDSVVNTAGSGYTSGASFNAELQDGVGTVIATFVVTANTLGNIDSIAVSEAGSYTTNPANLPNTFFTGGRSQIEYSTDEGPTWTQSTTANSFAVYGLCGNVSSYCAVGQSGSIQTSTNEDTWTNRDSTTNAHLYAVASNGSTYCAGGTYSNGSSVFVSGTAILWTLRTSANTNSIRGIAANTTYWIAVGNNGSIQTSSDSFTWTNRTTANTNNMRAVSTDAVGTWVAVGDNGSIQSSADGTTWTNRTTANTENMRGTAFGASVYVAVGDNGAIQSSADGTTWTNRTTANTENMRAVVFGNSVFMAVGDNGSIQSSADGTTWTNRTGANTNNLWTVGYNNTDGGHIAAGGEGSGLTVSVSMGAETVEIVQAGAYSIVPTSLSNNIPVSSGSGSGAQVALTFTASGQSDFLNQLSPNDYVYISAGDSTTQQIAKVASITNSTHMKITSNGNFACSESKIYLPQITATGTVSLVANTTDIFITTVSGDLSTGDTLVGWSSGAKSTINAISRNDVDKDMNSFIQLYKYDITISSGSFEENETIYQGDDLETSTSTATVHSVEISGNTTLYTSNQIGQFNTSNLIFGSSSLAAATINNKYSPELIFGSGDVIYLENIEEVIRETDKTERFQIIFTA